MRKLSLAVFSTTTLAGVLEEVRRELPALFADDAAPCLTLSSADHKQRSPPLDLCTTIEECGPDTELHLELFQIFVKTDLKTCTLYVSSRTTAAGVVRALARKVPEPGLSSYATPLRLLWCAV